MLQSQLAEASVHDPFHRYRSLDDRMIDLVVELVGVTRDDAVGMVAHARLESKRAAENGG